MESRLSAFGWIFRESGLSFRMLERRRESSRTSKTERSFEVNRASAKVLLASAPMVVDGHTRPRLFCSTFTETDDKQRALYLIEDIATLS